MKIGPAFRLLICRARTLGTGLFRVNGCSASQLGTALLRRIPAFLGLTAAILLSACSNAPQSVLIWTDMPELVIAVQHFNQTESRYVIDVEYHEYPALDLLTAGKSKRLPSLIIARFLQDSVSIRTFSAIDDIFSRYYLDPNDMYPGLLQAGKEGGQQRLIPVSFDPYLLVEKSLESASAGMSTIRLDELAAYAATAERDARGDLVSLGFSPWWDSGFVTSLLLAHGAAFSTNPGWKPSSVPRIEDIRTWPLRWDDAGLREGLEALMELSRPLPQQAELNAFDFAQGGQPGYQRVLSGRARLWPMKASDFFKLPQNVRSQLAYRYPVVNEHLVLSPDSRFLGIPRYAPRRDAALFFARWLLSVEHQKEIWDLMQKQRLISSHFGPFDAFGSLLQANDMLLPEYFPAYVQNRISAAVMRQGKYPGIPYPLPFFWDEFSRDCLNPWVESLPGILRNAADKRGTELEEGNRGTELEEKSVGEEAAAKAISAFKEGCAQYLGTMPDWMKASL